MGAERRSKAINDSLRLWESGDHQEALRILDDSIEEAVNQGEKAGVSTLSHHAAILCGLKPDRRLVKHYYQLSLKHNPENPMALYGLAKLALEDGETQIANGYAARCHRAILQSDDEIVKQVLWPELGK